MLIYMAVPVLIMVGLCIFSYMAGRYVRIGKKPEGAKAPETIKEPESPKEPDRVPMLEEEIRSLEGKIRSLEEEAENLREALEVKNKEPEKRDIVSELIMQENREPSDQARQEDMDRINKQREEIEGAVESLASSSQLEKEPAADDTTTLPVLSSYEDLLRVSEGRELEEKTQPEKPKEKIRRKKPKEKIARKPHKQK